MDDLAALIEPHIPALRRYAYALLRGDEAADDLVQDCLERALNRWHLRRKDGDLRAWLFAIERNLFLDGRRRFAREAPSAGPDALDGVAAPDPGPDAALRHRDVLAGLDLLPEEQRSVLLLVAVEDLSYADAARALDIPIGTVMSRLSRARERLRSSLDGGGIAVLRRVK